jgi:hypothetical protein
MSERTDETRGLGKMHVDLTNVFAVLHQHIIELRHKPLNTWWTLLPDALIQWYLASPIASMLESSKEPTLFELSGLQNHYAIVPIYVNPRSFQPHNRHHIH